MEPEYYLLYINLEFGDSSDYSRHLYSDLNVALANMNRHVTEAKRHFTGPGRVTKDTPMCKAWAATMAPVTPSAYTPSNLNNPITPISI